MDSSPTIAVLAGGLATRLGDLTATSPKALLDVHGRPFLHWQLELFARHGLRDVVLCTGRFSELIEDWVARNPVPGVSIRFSRDGARQLGTGGALRQALPLLGENFLVTYGDSYLRCDYLDVHQRFLRERRQRSPAPSGLMVVYENAGLYDTSNVIFRDGRIVDYDKKRRDPAMRHIDWGLGVLTAEALALFSDREQFDLAEVYGVLVSQGRLLGLEVHDRFFEVGSRSGLQEFRDYTAGTQSSVGSFDDA